MRSIRITDGNELICDDSDNLLCQIFDIALHTPVKVLSIFGNTGAGKSHTLNKLFFPDIKPGIFHETSKPQGGPAGVWGAIWKDPTGIHDTTLILDTEGIMGYLNTVEKEHIKSRMLLKILAISDVVVFRKWGERLTSDVFQFIDEASQIFRDFFSDEIVQLSTINDLPAYHFGASVIISHETVRSELLSAKSFASNDENVSECPSNNSVLPSHSFLDAAAFMKIFNNGYRTLVRAATDDSPVFDSFSSVEYVGVRSAGNLSPDISLLRSRIFSHLRTDSNLRIARPLCIVYSILMRLTSIFSNDCPLDTTVSTRRKQFRLLPSEFFRCRAKCKGCNILCSLPMNHWGRPHTPTPVKFSLRPPPKIHSREVVDARQSQKEFNKGNIPNTSEAPTFENTTTISPQPGLSITTDCIYRASLGNKRSMCRRCFEERGELNELKSGWLPSNATASQILSAPLHGDVLECSTCGVVWATRDMWMRQQSSPVRYGAAVHLIEHRWEECDQEEFITKNTLNSRTKVGGCVKSPFDALGFIFN